MTPDACRPVDVTVDGQPETIRVHGGAEPSPEAAEALGDLVAAARRLMAETPETVRERALGVLAAHWPTGGYCRCGSVLGTNAALWSVHMLRVLNVAGVVLPLDAPAVQS